MRKCSLVTSWHDMVMLTWINWPLGVIDLIINKLCLTWRERQERCLMKLCLLWSLGGIDLLGCGLIPEMITIPLRPLLSFHFYFCLDWVARGAALIYSKLCLLYRKFWNTHCALPLAFRFQKSPWPICSCLPYVSSVANRRCVVRKCFLVLLGSPPYLFHWCPTGAPTLPFICLVPVNPLFAQTTRALGVLVWASRDPPAWTPSWLLNVTWDWLFLNNWPYSTTALRDIQNNYPW